MADFISQKLDRPLYNLNGDPNGTVTIHGDPAKEYESLIRKMQEE